MSEIIPAERIKGIHPQPYTMKIGFRIPLYRRFSNNIQKGGTIADLISSVKKQNSIPAAGDNQDSNANSINNRMSELANNGSQNSFKTLRSTAFSRNSEYATQRVNNSERGNEKLTQTNQSKLASDDSSDSVGRVMSNSEREALKSKFSVTPFRNNFESSSIRDILKRKQKIGQSDASNSIYNTGELTGSTRSISESIVEGLKNIESTSSNISEPDDILEEPTDLSPGEIRYLQHRDKIERKRQERSREMPFENTSRYNKNQTKPNDIFSFGDFRGPPTTSNQKSFQGIKNKVSVPKTPKLKEESSSHSKSVKAEREKDNISTELNEESTDITDEDIDLFETKKPKKVKVKVKAEPTIMEEEEESGYNEDDYNPDEETPSEVEVVEEKPKIKMPIKIQDLKKLTKEKLEAAAALKQVKAEEAPKVQKSNKVKVQKELTIPADGFSLKDLSLKLGLRQARVKVELGHFMDMKGDEDENFIVDADASELMGLEFGFRVHRDVSKNDNEAIKKVMRNQRTSPPVSRPPVVCIMGHVDHGKTTLLDALRKSNIAAQEAGGITQKLSAFTVQVKDKKVVFLDTPGHAAFSSMRSSGADATDIVVLVVAVDDGVQPQTREAAAVALKAKRSIIVALNKIDAIPLSERSSARSRVLSEIAALDIVPEDFGGETQVVEISARTREGIDKLVESLVLQSEVLELTACDKGRVEAIVLGSNVEKGLGVVVDAIVKEGELLIGDIVLIGTTYGKVKNIYDDTGKAIKRAGPSIPVRITGLKDVPLAGQEILGMESEGEARSLATRRIRIQELRKLNSLVYSTEQLEVVSVDKTLQVSESQLAKKDKVVNVMLKADSIGTLDALTKVIMSFSSRTTDVRVNIVDRAIGPVTISDVDRAYAVKNGEPLILAFNVGISNPATKTKLKSYDIKVVQDTVIYRLEEALHTVMESKLAPVRVTTSEGMALVQKVFILNDKAKTAVAGLRVKSGKLQMTTSTKKEYLYRVHRGSTVVQEDIRAVSLKRFKDSVTEVEAGQECGLTLEFSAYEENDEIECYSVEWVSPKLQLSDPIVFTSLEELTKQDNEISMSL